MVSPLTLAATGAIPQTGRNILVAGIRMHFTQNSTMICLAGIFDGFPMPLPYWPVLFVITTLVSGWVVIRWGAGSLAGWSGKQPT